MDAKLTYSMLYLWIISLISSLTVNCLIAKQQTRFPSLNNELSIFRSRFVSIQLQDNLFFIFKTFLPNVRKKIYWEKMSIWVYFSAKGNDNLSIISSILSCNVSKMSEEMNRKFSPRSWITNLRPNASVSSRWRRNCFIAGSHSTKIPFVTFTIVHWSSHWNRNILSYVDWLLISTEHEVSSISVITRISQYAGQMVAGMSQIN